MYWKYFCTSNPPQCGLTIYSWDQPSICEKNGFNQRVLMGINMFDIAVVGEIWMLTQVYWDLTNNHWDLIWPIYRFH